MDAVRAFAGAGNPLIGICNGFQVLLEAELLPGAMLRNRALKYRCEHIHVRVGKSIRLVVEANDEDTARAQVAEMCDRLLANPVIEDFSISVVAAEGCRNA